MSRVVKERMQQSLFLHSSPQRLHSTIVSIGKEVGSAKTGEGLGDVPGEHHATVTLFNLMSFSLAISHLQYQHRLTIATRVTRRQIVRGAFLYRSVFNLAEAILKLSGQRKLSHFNKQGRALGPRKQFVKDAVLQESLKVSKNRITKQITVGHQSQRYE